MTALGAGTGTKRRRKRPARPEAERLHLAISALVRAGGMAATDVCCLSCGLKAIEAEHARGHGDPGCPQMVVTAADTEAAFPGPDDAMRDVLRVGVRGSVPRLVGIFRGAGLRAFWSGTEGEPVEVYPDARQ